MTKTRIFFRQILFLLLISNLIHAQWKEVAFNGNGTPSFIKALDSQLAIINAYNHPDYYLYYTEDGGELWQEISMPNVKYYHNYIARDYAFTSLNKIWMVADSSVYFTSDRGKNWRIQKKLTQGYYMQYIEMFDSINGIASAANYHGKKIKILRTTNGGLSWSEIIPNLFDGAYFDDGKYSMSFVSNYVGFFMPTYEDYRSNGRLYKTNSGGLSWTLTNFNSYTKSGNYLKFVDDKTGYVFDFRIFSPSILFKTVDGGKNWESVLEFSKYIDHDDARIGTNNKYPEFVSFASYRSFWVSNDYGKTWVKFDSTQSQFGSCNDLSIADRNTGWLITGGGWGKIYKCDNISTITNIVEENKLLSDFGLDQNYPNPFNPTTTIKYTIPNVASSFHSNQNVTIKIFDIVGTEIAVLVNEQKSAGSHEVIFDASKLSSGIYFYQLVSGGFIKTNKMVLLK